MGWHSVFRFPANVKVGNISNATEKEGGEGKEERRNRARARYKKKVTDPSWKVASSEYAAPDMPRKSKNYLYLSS